MNRQTNGDPIRYRLSPRMCQLLQFVATPPMRLDLKPRAYGLAPSLNTLSRKAAWQLTHDFSTRV